MPRLCLRVLQLAVACAPATAFFAAGARCSEWGPVLATLDCDSILCHARSEQHHSFSA